VKFFGEMCVLSFIYSYVQVFDPWTGQASKNEQGKGEIQVVMDWYPKRQKLQVFF